MNNEKILKMMHCNNSSSMQEDGIELAMQENDLTFLIQPDYYPYSWDNCAEVIRLKSDLQLKDYVKWMRK